MSQKALFVESAPNGPQVVRTKGIPTPGPGQLLVKVLAAGLNPADYLVRALNVMVTEWPAVLGLDGAGVVEQVGEGVVGFAKGDKVLFQGQYTDDSATFQQLAVSFVEGTAKLPPNVSIDSGASIPLTLATAGLALYSERADAGAKRLTPPWEVAGQNTGEPIVIFGGSTSVGQFAIQLAKLSGFAPIIATASPHNAAHLKSLGATHVIDRTVHADPSGEVRRILDEGESEGGRPLEVVFSSAPDPSLWGPALALVAPGGTLVLAAPPQMTAALKEKAKCADTGTGTRRYIADVSANIRRPENRALADGLYAQLTRLLAGGVLKPNRVEVLPGGLAGIPDGLQRMHEGKVSGVKLIAHPQDTA